MWGEAFYRMGPSCMPRNRSDAERWIQSMDQGHMCPRNWLHNTHDCSSHSLVPNFQRAAPALLGTDSRLFSRCRAWMDRPLQQVKAIKGSGKQACILAGYNALALFGDGPRYNMCRNLEWVVCAAQGKLHAQTGAQLVFDPPPNRLIRMSLASELELPSLAAASGAGDPRRPPRYSMELIYLVEVCLLSALCANGDQLFTLTLLQPFVCKLRPGAIRKLVHQLEAGRIWRHRDSVAAGPR